ncbi:MAG: hypothetical protein AAFY53_14345 [Pseudomonadota bacterium]
MLRVLIGCVLLLAASAAPAVSAKRAFVVGINAYSELDPSDQLERAAYDAKRQQVFLKINGDTYRLRTGDRVDFMTTRRLRALTEGRARCYLDLTNVRAARGAPVTATFRLNCI